MTDDEINKYYVPACKGLGLLYKAEHYAPFVSIQNAHELDALLCIEEYYEWTKGVAEPMSEELKHLLTMLAGPHSKTVLKAYRIRKGLE